MLDRVPGVRVISNFGVGVDHIDVAAATARRIPVGNGLLRGGPDPDRGTPKRLVVSYSVLGQPKSKEIDENVNNPNYLVFE